MQGIGGDALAGLKGAAPAASLLIHLCAPACPLPSLPHSFIRRPDAPIYVLTGNAGAGFTHSFPTPANVPSWVAAGWQVRHCYCHGAASWVAKFGDTLGTTAGSWEVLGAGNCVMGVSCPSLSHHAPLEGGGHMGPSIPQ